MSKFLRLVNSNGTLLADSREVAEMVGKQHSHLCRDIQGYINVLVTNPKLDSLNFFVESNYKDKKGEVRKCYLLTRKGCDMVANKLTGEKGILFTAEYVTAFEEMEKQIKSVQTPQSYIEALESLLKSEKEKLALQDEKNKLTETVAVQNQQLLELKPKASYYDVVLNSPDLISISVIAKDYGKTAQWMNSFLKKEGIQFKQGNIWLLYKEYAQQGYTQTKTQSYNSGDGIHTKPHTYWTQKGRLFIYDLLKKNNILPIVERIY